nr:hypothetical protein CFP56_12434 [Quercus suber]
MGQIGLSNTDRPSVFVLCNPVSAFQQLTSQKIRLACSNLSNRRKKKTSATLKTSVRALQSRLCFSTTENSKEGLPVYGERERTELFVGPKEKERKIQGRPLSGHTQELRLRKRNLCAINSVDQAIYLPSSDRRNCHRYAKRSSMSWMLTTLDP